MDPQDAPDIELRQGEKTQGSRCWPGETEATENEEDVYAAAAIRKQGDRAVVQGQDRGEGLGEGTHRVRNDHHRCRDPTQSVEGENSVAASGRLDCDGRWLLGCRVFQRHSGSHW
jgi:hypothetical protein